MILSAIAVAAILQTYEYPFRSEGPLEISNVSYPEVVNLFEPVEITFDLNGTWNNPFDTNQIDVSGTIIGAENTGQMVNGFVVYDTSDRTGPARTKWMIRFTPWNIGGYGVFVRIADSMRTIEYPKIGIRVNKGEGGFFRVERNAQYISRSRQPQILAGTTWEARSNSAPEQLRFDGLAKIRESGATLCRVVWSGAGADDWRNLSEISIAPDASSFRTPQFVEAALGAAKRSNLGVILTLSSASELTPGRGWEKSRYNKANGGPCEKPEDFWMSLRARLMYKRSLRYLVSRLQNFDNIVGIEFFDGIEAPGYWIQEMSNEVAGVHTQLLPMSTFPGAPDVWKLQRIGYASIPVRFGNTPGATAAIIVSDLRASRATTNRPLVPIAQDPAPSPDHARAATWAALFCGAATATILSGPVDEKGFYDPFNAFAKRISWLTRKLVDVVPVVQEDLRAWALADDLGAIVLVLPEGGRETAGTVALPVRRNGNYVYTWFDTTTGEEVGNGEVRSTSNNLTVPIGRGTNGVVCEIVRK